MLKRYRSAAIGLGALLITSAIAFAAGNFSTYPFIGGASFCASTVSGAGGFSFPQGSTGGGGNTGQGQAASGSLCAQTVPAGPPTFNGTEYFPVDIGITPGLASPTTAVVTLMQMGQGPLIDSVSASAAITIPNLTSWFVLDTGTAATVAVTFPSAPVEGQIQHLVCGVAVGTGLSVVANTGQAVKNNTPATCAAGASFAWRFVAVANGTLAANTWVRIQ